MRVHGCLPSSTHIWSNGGFGKRCLAVTDTLNCAVVRLRGNAAHMLALAGEVNPQADRDFAGRFTVASFKCIR